MKTGIELITEERARQVEKEGWKATHDDKHKMAELATAAICYIRNAMAWIRLKETDDLGPELISNYKKYSPKVSYWPWASKWWKPKNEVRDLIKAGALIAAEIDRLQRMKQSA